MKILFWMLALGSSSNQVPVVVNPLPVTVPATTRALVASAPSPVALRVQWDYPFPNPVAFEVWASGDLKTWALARTTTNREAVFLVRDREFYKVRTVDPVTGDLSGWATTAGNTP